MPDAQTGSKLSPAATLQLKASVLTSTCASVFRDKATSSVTTSRNTSLRLLRICVSKGLQGDDYLCLPILHSDAVRT